jgi:hypothetical protein
MKFVGKEFAQESVTYGGKGVSSVAGARCVKSASLPFPHHEAGQQRLSQNAGATNSELCH